MAIDNINKRRDAAGSFSSPIFAIPPYPDGLIDADDKKQVNGIYASVKRISVDITFRSSNSSTITKNISFRQGDFSNIDISFR